MLSTRRIAQPSSPGNAFGGSDWARPSSVLSPVYVPFDTIYCEPTS